MLHEFLTLQREEIIARTRRKMAARDAPWVTEAEMQNGVPLFLDQLADTLRREQQTAARPTSPEMAESALLHGGELRNAGFTLGQVVHGYGDVCQAVTGLAMELEAPISADEFKTLNRCLDEAIAQAVTEFARQRDISVADRGTEQQGFFVHEIRNLLGSALMALEVMKTGTVGISGSTGAVLERNLFALRDLVNRSVATVRVQAGLPQRGHVLLTQLLEEIGQAAAIEAKARRLQFTLGPVVEPGLAIDVDRQALAAALTNLLQNAFKFSRSDGHIILSTDTLTTAGQVLIEVEDECGGLADGAEGLFRPFEQRNTDRSGLGLGLASARESVHANGGELHARNLPGKGCIFTISLPLFHGPAPGSDELAVSSGEMS